MENSTYVDSAEQPYKELPSLFNDVTSKRIAGFDDEDSNPSHLFQSTWSSTSCPSPDCALAKGVGTMVSQSKIDASQAFSDSHRQMHSISTSRPASPSRLNIERSKRVIFGDQEGRNVNNRVPNLSATSISPSTGHPKVVRCYSHRIWPDTNDKALNLENQRRCLSMDRVKDRQFDAFKTWSGRLEKQLSHLRGKQVEPEPEAYVSRDNEIEALPVDRYFDSLEGPELDTLKVSEELVLPVDRKWPFLLRYPISSFGICLGLSSQAILWKTLATSKSMSFLHISLTINLVLWCISVALMVTVFFTYSLKVIFYFEAVRREYYHPVRVNFFFAPWIASLFLVLGVPPLVAKSPPAAFWYILMAPIVCLELKIYGQWMSAGQRRLSKVANPSNHLSIVGNFVGALLGASMGLKEGPIFFFAVGLAHYMVLFVTLYQRLPTNETLPKELHPVFFLFVAAPSVASMAWAQIQGVFDYFSRIAYFIALFLYFSLVVRINFFRGFRFSLAWWAYTFPMTGASIVTIRYSNEVTNLITQILSVGLSSISTFTVTALLVTTILHAFVLRDLFPNDVAIAISHKKSKAGKKKCHLRAENSVPKDVEASPQAVSPQGCGIGTSLESENSFLSD